MIRRIDQWIGTRLFHPPIVWLCQRTGMTQYAVARYGWMLAAWTLVMRISFEGVGDWIFSALILVVTLLETWRAAVMPDAPTRRSDGLRILILLFAAFDLCLLVVVSARHGFPGFRWGHAWDLFALTAEYAKTIRTIPPRRRKSLRQTSSVNVPVRSRAGNGSVSRRHQADRPDKCERKQEDRRYGRNSGDHVPRACIAPYRAALRPGDRCCRLQKEGRASSAQETAGTSDARPSSRGWTGGPAGRYCDRSIKGDKIMNNADLAEKVAGDHGLSKADARKIVDAIFAAITDAAAGNDEVSLAGFGKFKVKESAAREGRNPATGETIKIAASKKLGFTPAKAVKDRLNG